MAIISWRCLKQDERLTQIPVILLTGSGAQYDIQQW